ncbi:PEP-CTERM system TPR-repeat protein PrsT [Alteromonas sp. MMG017]|uniref:XrtA/PEP-CTERM system TPR-repeat protein PrsT n=1 Tax=Alteromonas sp. MMG017 TaxID=2822692 RepID=UPI001B3A7A14|nr:PEP-CTERM system TPR-repeat protein PrsT [Alteromonas sp. MMG017]
MTSTKLNVFIFSVILLSACSEKSSKEYIDIASKHQSDGNYQAASIALKNAIKQDSNNVDAREMLGDVYLHQGLYSAAEKELSRANTDSSKVSLAESLLWQEKFAEIRELTVSNSLEKSALIEELNIYKAIALIREGNSLKSLEKFASLADTAKQPEVSNLASAYIAGLNNNIDRATTDAKNSLQYRPNYLPALQFKSKVEIQQKQWTDAINTLNILLSLRPADYKIKLQLSDALINNGDFLAAEPLVDNLLKISSEQPYFNQLKGAVEFSKGNFQTSLIHLDKAIKNGGSNTTTRLLASLANYNLGSIEQAYQNLSVVINNFPKNHFAYKLFTVIQLQLGYNAEASESVGLISDLNENDTSFIIATSNSLLKNGDSLSAKLLLNQINSSKLEDSKTLRALGSLKILANDKDGIEDLEKSYSAEPDSSEALFILASAYLDSGEFDRTLRLADEWLKKNPNDVAVINLKARTYGYMQEIHLAEETYYQSLTIDSTTPSALLFLAEVNIKRDNIEKALRYLETLVLKNPLNIEALVRYFQVHELLGNHEKALVPMRNAIDSSDDVIYDLIYVGSLASQGKVEEQVAHLLSISEQGKNEPKYWMLLGDALWEKGNTEESINAYTNWLNKEKSFSAFVKNIRVAEMSGDISRALVLADQATTTFPQQRELDLILTHLLILNKNYDKAQRVLNATPANLKSTASGLSLQGRLLLVKKEYNNAEGLFRRSYAIAANTDTARFLYTALVKQNSYDEGIKFAENHIKQDPNDTAMRLILANELMNRDQQDSIEHFKYLALNASPASPLVLNNLAWLLVENNKANEALGYIEQALALLPQNPTILATAGNVYVSLKKYDKAIQNLKAAYEKAPSSFQIALDYIEALHKSGNKDYAKIVFTKLEPKSVEQQNEASALYDKLEE